MLGDALLGAYGGVSADAPLCGFAEELIAAYPEAKVVVERDVESWFRSFDMTAGRVLLSPTINLVARCDPAFLGPVWGCYRRWTRGQMGADTLAELRANARQRYRDHYAHVRQVTPPERLLEFDLKDGWEPLCRFLGREVPNVPFPRVNDGNYMVKGVWTVVTFRVIAVLLKICLWVVPVVVAMVGWRLYGKGD